jgi:hypothetical protein
VKGLGTANRVVRNESLFLSEAEIWVNVVNLRVLAQFALRWLVAGAMPGSCNRGKSSRTTQKLYVGRLAAL